jgi:hypothetical protein
MVDTPMIAPSSSRIGETLIETVIASPSLRNAEGLDRCHALRILERLLPFGHITCRFDQYENVPGVDRRQGDVDGKLGSITLPGDHF